MEGELLFSIRLPVRDRGACLPLLRYAPAGIVELLCDEFPRPRTVSAKLDPPPEL